MSFRYDQSPIALPDLFYRSIQVRTSYVLSVALFWVFSKLAAFFHDIFMVVVSFQVISREIKEVIFLFESVGRVPHRWEVVNLLDELKGLAFVAMVHNEYINIIILTYRVRF